MESPARPKEVEVWPLFEQTVRTWLKLLPRLSLLILPVLLPICILESYLNVFFPFLLTILPDTFPIIYLTLLYQVFRILPKIANLIVGLMTTIIALQVFHLHYQGAKLPTLRQAWKFGYSRLFRYISASLRAGFWILTGLVRLIVPGIRRFIGCSFVTIIAVIEEKEQIKNDIISDSLALTKGNEKKIYYMLLYLILFFCAYLVFMLLFSFALGLEGEEPLFNILIEAVGALVNPLLIGAWLPLYYQLKAARSEETPLSA